MIILITLGSFLTVALIAVAGARALSAPQARLRARVAMVSGQDSPAALAPNSRGLLRMQNYSAMPWLQRLLQRMPSTERIADELDRAGIVLRVGEFLALSVLLAILLAGIAWMRFPSGIISSVGMIVAALFGFMLPRWFVTWKMNRRRQQIETQLAEALDLLARSLRSGNGLLVSIDALVDQIQGPLAVEFGRMRREIAAGISVEDALQELDRRVGSKDLHIVVIAFTIQREVGGNLTEILENVAGTIRQRVMLHHEMRSLTSQQRFGGLVLALVPPGLFAFMYVNNPDWVRPVFSHDIGLIAMGVAAMFELAGILAIKWVLSSFEV